jgi:peptide deformylase
MAKRQIVFLDNPILRKKAQRVRVFDAKLHQLLDDMLETMIDAPGTGLAAPQVNVGQQVLIVRLPDDKESVEEFGEEAGKVYELINPEIIKTTRETVEGVEGCLSIPGYWGEVSRHVGITIGGQDRNGNDIRIKTRDWQARVFQHEIDHLNGVLFIDRASEVWKGNERPSAKAPVEATAQPAAEPEPGED